jgi:hypothetical protein
MRLLPLALLAAALVSCSTGEKIAPTATYQIGERVNLGHLAYAIYEKQWQNQFGNGVDAHLPQNRFLLLKLNIQNTGGAETIIPNTYLQDDAGQSYPETADADGAPEWIGNTRQLKPGASIQGYLIYDVPPKHYQLRILGEDEKQIAFVDIPLSFDSDVPDVTTPIEPNAGAKGK